METLCFQGNYDKRFGRLKEFSQDKVEVVLDEYLKIFCNGWLEEEFAVQSGAERYERTEGRIDRRGGHYWRELITSRGAFDLRVPRGERRKYEYTLFKHFKRRTEEFEDIVVEAILKGHSSRKASIFFEKLLGNGSISHETAIRTLRRFDHELGEWKKRPIGDDAVILVLDGVWFKGVIPYLKGAKPVLFAYAIYADGKEEVIDFELAHGESVNAWCRFCQRIEARGLKNVNLVVHDDNDGINSAVALVWPKALDQACILHVIKNFVKKLKGVKEKQNIVEDVKDIYKIDEEIDAAKMFDRKVSQFIKKWARYRNHPAFKYLYSKLPDTMRFTELPRKYWEAARTTNRLERLFEELKRRIKVFRRFPNSASCRRWLYALLKEQKNGSLM